MESDRNIIAKLIYGGGIFFDLTKWLILAVVILTIVNIFFISIFIVDGPSMEPYLLDKEAVLWDKNAFESRGSERGDIIVMNYPGDPVKRKYVKRIVGLPGEKVDIYMGSVYIDGKKLTEEYLPVGTITEPDRTWQVPSNQYVVLGDNRPNSNDSRYFDAVEKRFILGKALAIIYPRFWIIREP